MPIAVMAQQPADDGTIIYVVRKGDTLINLGRRYLIREADWPKVQKLNRVADPHSLSVGRRLKLPVNLLKYQRATATVAAFRGDAQAGAARGAMAAVTLRQALDEGARVATGPASSLSLALSDGSVLTLPSNSAMRITRLRKLVITDSIDYDLALDSGAVRSRVTPFRNPLDRFRLRNPIATSAVRGTDFRSRFDSETRTAFSELVEGGLAVSQQESPPGSPSGDTLLTPGFGAIISRSGGIATEKLLDPPSLISGGGVQRGETLAFAVGPVAGAASYRLQVARDSGFIDVVEDRQSATTEFVLPSLPSGNYFARITAIAESRLEGMPATVSFKRRLNATTTSAAASDEGYTFRWIAIGEGVRRYHFQLRADNAPVYLVDEAGLSASSLILSDLAPGRYAWRVGTSLYADGEVDTSWSEFESFTVDE